MAVETSSSAARNRTSGETGLRPALTDLPNDRSPACACGAPIAIQRARQCLRCYGRDYRARRRADALDGVCVSCGTAPRAVASTQECRRCHTSRRRQRPPQRFTTGTCETCRVTWAALDRSGACRWCRARRQPLSIDYAACHARIRSWRGPAREQRCSACGGQAVEWAYRSGPDVQRITGVVLSQGKRKRMTWSPNPADYDPMCRPCHGRRDREDYGTGYRSDPTRRRAAARAWSAASYARQVATDAGRAAYRERKRAELARRKARGSLPQRGGADDA